MLGRWAEILCITALPVLEPALNEAGLELTERFACLCLPSAVIKAVHHPHLAGKFYVVHISPQEKFKLCLGMVVHAFTLGRQKQEDFCELTGSLSYSRLRPCLQTKTKKGKSHPLGLTCCDRHSEVLYSSPLRKLLVEG